MDPFESELKNPIVLQLEYYFSDCNLIDDSFLTNLMAKEEGWISFDTLMSFNRIKKLVDNSKELLKQSLTSVKSDLIEVKTNEEKVRRRADRPMIPITEESKKLFNQRTVYVKGFPRKSSYEELMNWCQTYGTVEALAMRRKTKMKGKGLVFKGSIFVTFADRLVAERLVDEPVVTFGDRELVRATKHIFEQTKRQEMQEVMRQKLEAKVTGMALKPNKSEAVKMTTEDAEYDEELERQIMAKSDSLAKLLNVPKDLGQNEIKKYFDELIGPNQWKFVKMVLKIFSKQIAFVQFNGVSTAEEVFNKVKASDKSVGETKMTINGKEVVYKLLTEEEIKKFCRMQKKKLKYFKDTDKQYNYFLRLKDKRIRKLKDNPVLEELAVLHIDNSSKSLTTAKIKTFFKNYGNIVEIDGQFNIRFSQRFAARNILAMTKSADAKHDLPDYGVLNIDGTDYTARVLTGVEEKYFWLSSIDRIEGPQITDRIWGQTKKWINSMARDNGFHLDSKPKLTRKRKYPTIPGICGQRGWRRQ